MKILLLGDTHGQATHINWAALDAKRAGCNAILQLGDFGFWTHTLFGRDYIAAVEIILKQHDLKLYWIDGNHESHQKLRADFDCNNGMVNITPRLIYIPRGTRWEWEGVKFLGMGGAYSIDKADRHEFTSWWSEETITYSEVMNAIDGGETDILVSHDTPLEVPLEEIVPGFIKNDPRTAENRKLLQVLVDHTHPKLIVHGHYHHKYKYDLWHGTKLTKVYGFAHTDFYSDSYGILELDAGSWRLVD